MITSLVEFSQNNRKEIVRFLKFSVVGTIGFVVDAGTFNLLFLAGLNTDTLELVAKTISFLLAIISNFIWNRYWTYPDSRSKPIRLQIGQFFGVNVVGLLLNLLIFGTVGNFLTPRLEPLIDYGRLIANNAALVTAVGVVLFWNFFVNRHWTYNDVS